MWTSEMKKRLVEALKVVSAINDAAYEDSPSLSDKGLNLAIMREPDGGTYITAFNSYWEPVDEKPTDHENPLTVSIWIGKDGVVQRIREEVSLSGERLAT